MFIDENKIREKSKEGSRGIKGMIPTRFKKTRTPAEKRLEIARIVIGFCLTAGFAVGILALIYALVSGGVEYGKTLKKRADTPPQQEQVVEVILPHKSSNK